ncbi:ESCRT-III component, partial [Metarhizium majus ARSEF 297]
MSGAWGWFGGGAAQRQKDSPKNAIVGLREQLELLQKREKHLQNQVDEQYEIARKNVSSNKAVAKKALEPNICNRICKHQRETLGAMERAAAAMKQIHGKLTPEKVDETMDNLREQNALGEEIVEAMNSVNNNQLDDADLEAELEELQQEQLDEQMLKLSSASVPHAIQDMPRAVKREPPSKAAVEDEEEDDELRQLQAEMAM